jgi:hypothetical protein
MKIRAKRHLYVLIPVIMLLCGCSASNNDGFPSNVYFAAAADSGIIYEVSYREHRLVLNGVGPEMGWYVEEGPNVHIGTHEMQSCLSTHWKSQYTGLHIDAVIFEEDGQGSYDLRFITVSNPVYDEESEELSFDALALMTFNELTYVGDSIELGRLIIIFLNDVHESAYVALPSGETAGEDYNISNDMTSGIINMYQQNAEDFDNAVNKMIQDATAISAGDISSTTNYLNAMLVKIEAQTPLSDIEKNVILTCTKEAVTLPSCSDLTDSSCRQDWKNIIQSRIDALNRLTSTVNTATLTTDGMIAQAKQSIRDTIGGAASTVFKTIQKLAQQLGQ